EADGIDDQSLAFPMTDGMPVVTRNEILRMTAPVHVNDSEGLRSVFVEDVNRLCFLDVDKLRSTGRDELAWAARGLAARVRFEQIRFAILIQGSRPRLEGNLTLFRLAWKWRSRECAASLTIFDCRIRLRFCENRASVRMPQPPLSRRRAESRCAVRPP